MPRSFGRMAVAALLISVACGSNEAARDGKKADTQGNGELLGRVLAEPLERPDFTLTDTRGAPFDFRSETEGRLTLLFFGYTHCPDVCPLHMANIAAALDRIGWEARDDVAVVFVTTDPARDTPERIRAWLDRFDRSFIGLRGDIETVNAIQTGLGLPPSVIGPGDSHYDVGHAAQVLAFAPDGPARVAYPFGTRQSDWVHDLPRLLDGG